jgi:uncharacterized protein (DUF1810 family)
MNDDLERFRIAQQRYYPIALQEIKAGQKRSHYKFFHGERDQKTVEILSNQ